MAIQLVDIVRVLLAGSLFTAGAFSCSVSEKISNIRLVKEAETIVRVTALEYAVPPGDPNAWTSGVPDSKVRFIVNETIRGPGIPELVLPGYLTDRDDFNDQPSPYDFVRPGGRHGSCYANSYRKGGQFLLFLKKAKSGELTANWYALAPVNEQLHSGQDPWLLWVRKQVDGK